MLATKLPKSLFGLELKTEADELSSKVARVHSESFKIKAASLGGDERCRFVAAIALVPPTLPIIRSLCKSVEEADGRPVAICWNAMDEGMMSSLAAEGIAYIRDARNTYLPFFGASSSSVKNHEQAKPLSKEAQRIVLNLIDGRWDNRSAGDLAKLTGKSRASVTKYLAEIEASASDLIENRGTSRILRNPGYSKAELLDGLDEHFSNPVVSKIPLKTELPLKELQRSGALLSGETALSHFSDLAPSAPTTVSMEKEQVAGLKKRLGPAWCEAAWYEIPVMFIEIRRYPVDEPSDDTLRATGLRSVDKLNLYVECVKNDTDDVRYLDAVDQLKEQICHQ